MKRHLIPFWLSSASWGVAGKDREIARLKYYYDGEYLDRKILEIIKIDLTENEFKIKSLELDLKYDKINFEEFDRKKLSVEYSDPNDSEYKLKSLEIDLKYKRISEDEYNKLAATIVGEPWFTILHAEYGMNSDGRHNFAFELDWNDAFVNELRSAGWDGTNDNNIVDQWFSMVCKQVFSDSPEEFEVLPFGSPKIFKNKLDNNRSEYS